MVLRGAKTPLGLHGSVFNKGAVTVTFVICLWVGHRAQFPARASEGHNTIAEDTEWLVSASFKTQSVKPKP